MNTQTVEVAIKNVYGVDKIYPVCENGKVFAQIAGTKTLTTDTIAKIRKLGYTVIHSPVTVEI